MDTTAVSLAKVVVVDSGEVGRSAVYSRYNNSPWCLSYYNSDKNKPETV
jgi:hypothetical protein